MFKFDLQLFGGLFGGQDVYKLTSGREYSGIEITPAWRILHASTKFD
jgi:hypothetical protein